MLEKIKEAKSRFSGAIGGFFEIGKIADGLERSARSAQCEGLIGQELFDTIRGQINRDYIFANLNVIPLLLIKTAPPVATTAVSFAVVDLHPVFRGALPPVGYALGYAAAIAYVGLASIHKNNFQKSRAMLTEIWENR